MSVQAIKIVQEEFQKRRDAVPDIHSAHAQLSTLEGRIVRRIETELVELPEDEYERKAEEAEIGYAQFKAEVEYDERHGIAGHEFKTTFFKSNKENDHG
jgi:hypothetical protein